MAVDPDERWWWQVFVFDIEVRMSEIRSLLALDLMFCIKLHAKYFIYISHLNPILIK